MFYSRRDKKLNGLMQISLGGDASDEAGGVQALNGAF